jgi:hypothetical protein
MHPYKQETKYIYNYFNSLIIKLPATNISRPKLHKGICNPYNSVPTSKKPHRITITKFSALIIFKKLFAILFTESIGTHKRITLCLGNMTSYRTFRHMVHLVTTTLQTVNFITIPTRFICSRFDPDCCYNTDNCFSIILYFFFHNSLYSFSFSDSLFLEIYVNVTTRHMIKLPKRRVGYINVREQWAVYLWRDASLGTDACGQPTL